MSEALLPWDKVVADSTAELLAIEAKRAALTEREGQLSALQHSQEDGYQRAVAVLRGVAARSDSPAAKWAAEYLIADPDRWRRAERCWHSAECTGSGPDCEPERGSR
ncbi:hypothetical protein AB0F72_09180 [Actinoplanes sp. NPDC023936]|uniref:hypothetical protein n=1 Tax=Actinoplanes sp. NPDC023936 TaxID=3154910 RepID=UPI00340E0E82